MSLNVLLNQLTSRIRALPIVIFYATEGCNLACITCSYRDRLPNELDLSEILTLARQCTALGLREIVFSGGEPLLRRDIADVMRAFPSPVKRTLLTNGVLLGKRMEEVAPLLGEIIVSIDGATAAVHDGIRGIPSFNLIVDNICAVRERYPTIPISFRTTVQRRNFTEIPAIIALGKSLGLYRVSFLAVDVRSMSFGRDRNGTMADNDALLLTSEEVNTFHALVDSISVTYREEFERGFIAESPLKMEKLAHYFEAAIGGGEWPRVYCNAPMVSTVITATGDVLPCFFLPSLGNIRTQSLLEILNSKTARDTRHHVQDYSYDECHTCVCNLKIHSLAALRM